jgi:hypothetical protein
MGKSFKHNDPNTHKFKNHRSQHEELQEYLEEAEALDELISDLKKNDDKSS